MLTTRGLRRRVALLALPAIAALVGAPDVWAFKQGYHEQITEAILAGRGFDADSADEAGDSNYWTDVFESTNDAAHGDNNQLGAASARMRQKRTEIGDALNRCERRSALDRLGEALHTVQDVYSHSNSIDNGFPITDPLSLANGTAPCALPNFAPTGLVSGYFSVGGFMTFNQCRGIPANMCCHRDLNKDAPGEPNGARHTPALNAARGGTQTYMDGLEQDLRARFGDTRGNQLINLLKKKQRTTYFVIDDTGSMSTDIAGVKSTVNSLLDSILASGESPTLGLVSFKDSPSDRGITCDFEALRSQVNGLFASGGGDCPEASNGAMLVALSHFPEAGSDIQLAGGRLLLATDASAGDSFLGPQVAAEASRKGVSIDAILTGDCTAEEGFAASAQPFLPSDNLDATTFAASGVEADASLAGDPLTSISARTQLRALTEQTGGVLFNVSRVEVDDVAPTLLELGEPSTALLTSRKVDLVSGTPYVLDLPVDDTLDRKVTFMVTASRAGILPTLTLRRPGGAVVSTTDADATFRTLSSVKTIGVTAPAVGRWQIRLDGQGTFVVRAFGASDLRLDSVRLQVQSSSVARPEIDLIPLEGQPAVGDALVADFRFTEGPASVAVALRQPDGDLIKTLSPIVPLDSLDSLPTRRFRAALDVPGETFVVEATGTTAAGAEFVRQVTVPAQPQTVALSVSPESVIAAAGTSAALVAHVRNVGSADATYQLRATSSLPWSISGGGIVAIPAGGAADVGFNVFVPAGTLEGQVDQLTFFAEDLGTPRVRNSATASVVSGPTNRAPDCSGASATPGTLWPPDHNFATITLGGVTDPDGDAVTFTVTAITSDEAVDAKGSGNTAPDADGVGTSSPRVRAERSGNGDGRVYEIRFIASDGRGGSCSGSARVGVPHNAGGVATDSGQAFDATAKP